MSGDIPYTVWTFNRWYPPLPGDAPYTTQMEKLNIRSCIHERASGVFSINNLSEDTSLRARIIMTDLKGENIIDSRAIQICRAVYLGDQVGNIVADPLVPLNEAGDIVVPPKTREHFWIFFYTQTPGTYTGDLIIQPVTGSPSFTAPIQVDVSPLELPHSPLSTFTWDHFEGYTGEPYNQGVLPDTEGLENLYTEDLLNHHVNTFLIHYSLLPWPQSSSDLDLDLDFTLFDRAVTRKKDKGFLVIECSLKEDRLKLMLNLQFGTEEWDHVFTQWFLAITNHLEEMGISQDEVCFSFFSLDKRDDWDTVERLCHTASLVRKIDPGIKIFVDYGYKDPQCRYEYHTKAITAVLPFVDIVAVPHQRLLNEKELDLLRTSKKRIWSYTSNHYGYDHMIHSRNLCAYECYRIPFWRVFALQLDGCAVYSSTRWRGDPWNDWYFVDNTFSYDEATHEQCTVYNGLSGPVTSRRWEAWRMGAEDYAFLHMLKDEVANNENAQQYESLLQEACTEVVEKSNHPELASQWRWRIIEALLALRSSHG